MAAAWLMLRDTEQAKDAVQNALVRAWRDLPTLRDPERFDAWLQPRRRGSWAGLPTVEAGHAASVGPDTIGPWPTQSP